MTWLSKSLIAALDRRLVRRLSVVPLTIVAGLVGLIASPFLLLGAAIADRVGNRARWPRVRIVALILGALVIEVIGLVGALVIWVLTGFGLLWAPRQRWRLQRGLMGWYTNTMLGLVVRVIGSTIEWRDHADLTSGPVVLLARHTSFFDALIPATVICKRNQLVAHHVITQGLKYAPCIDIIGHRFPNHFVKRNPGEGSRELDPIRDVGAVLDGGSAAIIFPEGTFRDPQRFERVLRRLRRRQPERAERAEQLEHVLPPRPNGTFALLDGAPTADVVICTNTGLEPFGTLRQITGAPWTDNPIIIETWRIPRAEIPTDADAFDEWLFDQFVAVDAWVRATQTNTGGSR